MSLLKSIGKFIENISVTDRQEESIESSLSNLNGDLLKKDSGIYVVDTLPNGSYYRETNIRPLDDIDLFAELDFEKWKDSNGLYPNPQSVLTKIKNYLNDLPDYKDKVKQDRPCITIRLSDKDFDVLPSFKLSGGGYVIPSLDLKSWIFSNPEQLAENLDNVHRIRNYKVKQTIKAVKRWNRETGKHIPSFHIEEVAITLFQYTSFSNFEESIRLWFTNAESYIEHGKLDSYDDYQATVKRIQKVKKKLTDAKELYDKGKDGDAEIIWKDVFGTEFPTLTVQEDEAKSYSSALTSGGLKITSAGAISTTIGQAIPSSKGFYGSIAPKE